MAGQPNNFRERINRLIDQASENDHVLTNTIERVAEAVARPLELVNQQRYDTDRHSSTTMTLTTAKWTLNDYHQMIDAGILNDRRVELLNGEIVEMPSEGMSHAHLSGKAANYLRGRLGEQAWLREGHPITLPSSDSEPEPDIAIVENLGDEYLEHHPYPENIFWLIEYSYSTIAIDLEPKRKIYAAAGIREYWVVNLKTKTLIVFRDPMNDDYQWRSEFQDGAISPISFPDVVVEISRLVN